MYVSKIFFSKKKYDDDGHCCGTIDTVENDW